MLPPEQQILEAEVAGVVTVMTEVQPVVLE
jgi:hypothetical protein